MSRLLNPSSSGPSKPPLGAASWTISGVQYDHAAMQFWSALLDEVAEDFPEAGKISLEGHCDDLLVPEMLDPSALFTEELESLQIDEHMDETLREVAQELELIGPPSMVHATVWAKDLEVCSRDLPPDVIDAELLPIFLVWPLEWAGLSEFGWNRGQVSGRFSARDEARNYVYDVDFTLENNHVREGLFHRTMKLTFQRRSEAA